MLQQNNLTPWQVAGYLDRLGLKAQPELGLSGLNTLLLAQLTGIAFDSMDVWATGQCPSLELDDLYEKIIVNKRGGYCFELNTLFRSLLNGLGFDAYQCIAYILNPDASLQPPAHNIILCRLQDKVYFLDVGYGGPVPYEALELREGMQNGFQLKKLEDLWYVFRQEDNGSRPLIAFRDIPVTVNDLIPLNFYISQRSDVHFRHVIHLSRRNPDGSIYAIDGKEFKRHSPSGCHVTQLDTIAQVKQIVMTYFDMDPDTMPWRTQL